MVQIHKVNTVEKMVKIHKENTVEKVAKFHKEIFQITTGLYHRFRKKNEPGSLLKTRDKKSEKNYIGIHLKNRPEPFFHFSNVFYCTKSRVSKIYV